MADNEKTEELSLEELVRENFSNKVADKFLEEFEELPSIITELSDVNESCGEFYDYVKECAKEGKVPSGLDYCKKFIKDGKYTLNGITADTYEEFVNSDELLYMCQV